MNFPLPKPLLSLGLASAALLLSACAGSGLYGPQVAKLSDGVLVGAGGMTLYTFDKDVAGSGKSVCNGPCATNWPPLLAAGSDAAAGDYSIVIRDDGKRQWAFKGKPLYYWIKDQKPGDRTGEGFNNVWRSAKP